MLRTRLGTYSLLRQRMNDFRNRPFEILQEKKKNRPAITGPTGTKLYSPPVLRISLKWAPTPAEPGRCEQDRGWVRRAWEPG